MYHHDPSAPINSAVLQLLRCALWNEPYSPAPGTDWDAVWTELRQHAVQILPVNLLVTADPANRARYLQAVYGSVAKYYKLMQEQQHLCRLLGEAGIPCAILKGASAAKYYPVPANRRMGDIDLIVAPQHFEQARQLLCGCCQYLSEDRRHIGLSRNGISIELHRRYGTFNHAAYNELLDDWIFQAIPKAAPTTQEGFLFPSLPRKENGLTLLTHLNIHMESGLGLRQIIDWMMFVNRDLDDNFWNSEFGPAARQLGLETLAVTTTRMCQLYLGLRNDLTWCQHGSDDLCAELMEHIMCQGNFGRKLPKSFNQTVSVLSTAKSIPALFRALQYRGCINWEAVQRFPWLKPFAWIYQLCRYIRLGLRKKAPFRSLVHAMRNTNRQDTLLDRLGVTRMKEER